jgi:hypothetical protein
VAEVRAVAGLARADSARAERIPGTLGARNATVPLAILVARVPRTAGPAPVGRGPRPAAPGVRGPVATVPQAGRPSPVQASAGRAARRKAHAARAMPPPPAGGPGERRARQLRTGCAARAGHRVKGLHGPAAYLAVRRQRGPRTVAESAAGVPAREVPRVPTEPRAAVVLRVLIEPRGLAGPRALAGTTPARPATAGPRGRRIGARAATGAEAAPEAEVPAVPHRAVGERGPAMRVGQTGPRADATRRVPPGAATIAGPPRAVPRPDPDLGPVPGPAVPGICPVVAARPDPNRLQRTSRGSRGCRYPIRSPPTSLIPRRGPS